MSTFPRRSNQTATRPAPQISEERRQTVETARRSWIRKLIDLSRRNNLLYFRPLKTGTLELTAASSERLRDLLVGESVSAAKLLPNLEDDLLAKILRDISRRALENSEEKGLSTLFVTFGMATWPALDGGRPAEAPVLLLPVAISKKEGSNSYYLSAAGSFQLNLVLLHVLEDQFKVKLQAEELLAEFAGEEEEGTVLDIKGLCGKIQRLMADTRGFEIGLRVVLGNFAFQKMAMVKDLQERANDLPVHDVIAAIAGDDKAKTAINAEQTDPDPREFDRIPPDNEFLVLDADSSQQRAIGAVLADQSRVIHGPPGTGKSQTITNLIASLAAAGRRILFVAEKKAALEVVKRRLEEVGLRHLAIDLHGADLSPKKVMQQVAHTLEVVRSSVPMNCQQVHAQLVDRRGRLNSHVERMHCHREPTGMSVYEMQGLLLRLGRTVNAATRWRGAELARLTPGVSQQVTDLLAEAGGLAPLFLRTDLSPWTGATVADGESGQSAVLTQYLGAMAKFRNYSFGNIMLIAKQKPDATHVAGYRTWTSLGRFVRRGEKGIFILAPMVGNKRNNDENAEQNTDAKETQRTLYGFRGVYVFDVTQTEGKDLPTLTEVNGDVTGYRERLFKFVESQTVELSFSERIAPAKGLSHGGKITLLSGMQPAEEFSTLVHEIAHEMLHRGERRTMTTKQVRETEAEAVAFVVCQSVGLQNGTASQDYIQLWHGDANLLRESLEAVQQTAAVILGGIAQGIAP